MQKTEWNAELYNTNCAYVTSYGQELLPLLQAKRGERILDLGCGTGILTQEIAKTGAEVIGIDSSADMLKKAQEYYANLTFQIGDGQDFHFIQPFLLLGET